MKTLRMLYQALALATAVALSACGKTPDTAGRERVQSPKEPGPNGGRLITATDPQAEFLLLSDGRAQLAFLDEGKPVAATSETANLVTGDGASPTQLAFQTEDEVLVTTKPLPKIDGQPAFLTIQTTPAAAPVIERFELATESCSVCRLQEYACICSP